MKIEIAIRALIKAKEQIDFSVKLNCAIDKNIICPKHFQDHIANNDSGIDWRTDVDNFKNTAKNTMWYAIGGAILTCTQSYPRQFWVKSQKDNPSLFAGQQILKHIRDAFAHPSVCSLESAILCWDIKDNKKTGRRRTILKIDDLNITFDENALHGQQLRWQHLGGFPKFLNLLDYLIQDLKQKID